MKEIERKRKERRDKGLVMATRRDLACIEWIAEQYAIRFDQLLKLLSRFPDRYKPFLEDGLMAESTAKGVLDRWRRAGWVEYHRFLADEPGYLWVTKKGMALVGLDTIYPLAHAPASTRLAHIYAVNQLRLWMDLKYLWKSERRYRSEQTALLKKGDKLGPIPDALIKKEDGLVIAIEVEISPKKPADVLSKLVRLVRKYTSSSEGYGYESAFPVIWFYVPNKPMEKLIKTAIEGLHGDEERNRVSVGVQANLLASRFANG